MAFLAVLREKWGHWCQSGGNEACRGCYGWMNDGDIFMRF